jgi:hypothetical protein
VAQIKARWYYIFWAIMTAAVVGGQLYVGHGYKTMSDSVNNLTKDLSKLIK